MRLSWNASLFLITLALSSSPRTSPAADDPIGFAPGSQAARRTAEAAALAVPSPEKARAWLRTLTDEPHVAGTAADKKTAEFVRDKLREWGWTADLVEYEVLLNYPIGGSVDLTLLGPEGRDLKKLKVMEDVHVPDKDSADPTAFPAFHGYGASGTAMGQVVYGNYGTPADFDALEKMGVEVKGKIVLLRYGGIFRGLKVLNAQKRGAAGVLIYSDPADDGYAKGDTYPHGPYRPASAIQRGSVQFLSLGPGDPSTPGTPSVKGAKRLPIDGANGFPGFGGDPAALKAWEEASGLKRDEYFATIPSLPISYESALPILEGLGGPNVPGGWQGGLPFAYHVGAGPARVSFSIAMDYQVRTIWNVIARLEGSAERDRWVMIGNHRDAWVHGAVDPSSGTAATLETCRALGAAVKAGWKPRRTILYASWDAEEYGLVGSTEWAEEHADEIGEKAVLMLNVDSAVGGPNLDFDGIPSLRDLALGAAADVTDPRTGKSLADGWLAKQRAAWAEAAPVDLDRDGIDPTKFEPMMNSLGSGSDYTPFVDHLGIPALDVNFGGRYGVYHSIYDNFFWMEHFGDPEFLLHATAARLYTLIAMRAAGADVVPMRFTPYAEALRKHLDDLRRTVDRKARATGPDAEKPPIAFEGLGKLQASIKDFGDKASSLDKALDALDTHDGASAESLAKLNDALTQVERSFLTDDGLPGRAWFKHAIYAPGLTTGYASWPLPGVYQAIAEGDAKMLAEQLPTLVERIDAASKGLEAATKLAEAAAERAK